MRIDEDSEELTWADKKHLFNGKSDAPQSPDKSGREDQLRIIKHSLDAVQRRFASPEPGKYTEILEEGDLSSTHGSEKPFHHVSTVQFAPATRSILVEQPDSEPLTPQMTTKDW
uniref:Uncharacterized protein n=1 Tax=Ditylenchus dipsaci TaxID=166011 RepID=A0A915END1_9BILA